MGGGGSGWDGDVVDDGVTHDCNNDGTCNGPCDGCIGSD